MLQFKIIICLTLMGPQWWLKRAIEQVRIYEAKFARHFALSGLLCTIKCRFVIEFVVHVVFCLIQVYNQGLRNMDLMLIITTLCLPTIGCLGMALTVPYVFARSFIPLFGKFPTFGIRVCSH